MTQPVNLIYNETKKRKATPNEIAKYLIMDKFDQLCDNLGEQFGTEHLNEDQLSEVMRHIEKHEMALIKKFNLDYIILK